MTTDARRLPRVATLLPAAALVLTCACGCAPHRPASGASAVDIPTPPSSQQLRNMTVGGVFDQPVSLTDGVYEGPPFVPGGASRPTLRLWDELVAFGDLDATPGQEAVVLLSENSGGSGERVYLAVVGTADGRAVNLGTVLVGDRTKVRTLHVLDARIVLDVVEAGPQEPACCPTRLARKTYAMDAGVLRLLASDVKGTLSVATLGGVEWRLVEINGKPLPAQAEAPTLSFQDTRVAGFGGCNRYSGQVQEVSPGEMTFSPLAATRMACPQPAMGIEDDFFGRLAKMTGYTFLAGRLALTGQDGDTTFLLLFAAEVPAAPARP